MQSPHGCSVYDDNGEGEREQKQILRFYYLSLMHMANVTSSFSFQNAEGEILNIKKFPFNYSAPESMQKCKLNESSWFKNKTEGRSNFWCQGSNFTFL